MFNSPFKKLTHNISFNPDRYTSLDNPLLSPIGRFQKLLGAGRIRGKILSGYVLSIAIACIGATTARIVEEYANELVEERAETLQERAALLNEMDIALLELHGSQSRLLARIDNPEKLQNHLNRLTTDASLVKLYLEELDNWLAREEAEEAEGKLNLQSSAIGAQEKQLQAWLPQSQATIREYTRQLRAIAEPLTDKNIGIDRREDSKIALVRFGASPIFSEFGDRTDELTAIARAYIKAKDDVVHKAYEGVEELESIVMAIGLSIAAFLGILMAVLLSGAISRPLEVTNAIAKRVTKEGNFELQAPVVTRDEAGQLANSLNQLICQVARMLQEIKAAQAQLVQSEKMSSLGKLAAGLAHEINNPVSFIQGNVSYINEYTTDLLELLEMYRKTYPEPPRMIRDRIEEIDLSFLEKDLPESLQSIHVGAERIHQIVLSMRIFSRLDEAGVKEVDLHEGIDHTLIILNSQIEGQIEIEKNYGSLPTVFCHPVQINQVFMNLLSNAIDALKDRAEGSEKRIEIVTEMEDGTASPQESRVRVKIRDTGPGIPPGVRDCIFDPFFTTKPVGSGTGLGLSTSYEIVRKHGGTIVANSEPGKGAEFVVTLPVRSVEETETLQRSRPRATRKIATLPYL